MLRMLLTLVVVCVASFEAHADRNSPIKANPAIILLDGADARQTILLEETNSQGKQADLTTKAAWSIQDPIIADLSASRVKPKRNGKTTVTARIYGQSISIPLEVRGMERAREFHFENDIEPLFGRFGCNTSGCHGKAEGQNGFKLSVFGFDPEADYAALVKEARGRRFFPEAPERSLFLTKAAGQVPHGGGVRIPVGSEAYELLRNWIAAGVPFGKQETPRVKQVRVEPNERVMTMHAAQQLRVMATYTDGREIDVTALARFQTNNEAIATVNSDGITQTLDIPGEATIMASYHNASAIFRVMVPQNGFTLEAKPVRHNIVDDHILTKLSKLNVQRSGLSSDATFHRRAFLDIIGTLPTPEETRTFLADTNANKRQALINRLLDRPEYADLWALKWADVLRVDRQVLGQQRAYDYYRWIHGRLANNTPFDQFAREIITADGPLDENPPANFFKVVTKPGEAANTISQVFLGVRLACAECHHHPFDRWGQDDYYKMAAFFTPMSVRKIGNIEAITTKGNATATHLRTGKLMTASPLGQSTNADIVGDRRTELAQWMTAANNPYFAKNIVNRLWAHFMGRGLIEPVDDIRATNPPSNPELLDALATEFIASGYNVKRVIKLICESYAYQTATASLQGNVKDEQNHSRMLLKRPAAEVLLDMLSSTTGVAEKFEQTPTNTRATQLWDSKVRHPFLKQFGRPSRASACECERNEEPSIAQVLNLLNGDAVNDKLRHDQSRIAVLARKKLSDTALCDELYLLILSRLPTNNERNKITAHLQKNNSRRREAIEDIAWALLNTKEFLFIH